LASHDRHPLQILRMCLHGLRNVKNNQGQV
jgi:hypothetical protein